MVKLHSTANALMFHKKWLLVILALVSLSTLIILVMRVAFVSCDIRHSDSTSYDYKESSSATNPIRITPQVSNPLNFMKSKLVLLVSHELSLSGGPLLLKELAFLLRGVGTDVVWITYQKPTDPDEVVYSLENKMLDRGVQVLSSKGPKTIDTALQADLVVLNTAVAGRWLDTVLKENVHLVLPKVLWWIHEMRGHYFKLDYVKHLPMVAVL